MITHPALHAIPLDHDVEEVTVVERVPVEPLCKSCRRRTTSTTEIDLMAIPRILWPCVKAGNFSYCATDQRMAYYVGDDDEAASEPARKEAILGLRNRR